MTCSRILMIVLIAAAVCLVGAGMAASEPTEQWNKTLEEKSNDDAYSIQETSDEGYILTGRTESYGSGSDDDWLIKFSGESNATSLVETLAKDTWNYLKTFNENHLPFNWYRIDINESGRYFNPAEVGFYALSPILSYDMGLDCDGDGIFEPKNASLQEDDWDCSINRTSSTLNRIEALSTYQQSAHDIWKLGDNEAPPDYSPAAFDEFNQTKPFNPHYYTGTNISDFPKEINDGDFTQIFIYFNLTKEEADNEQLLFLDTLDATHGNVHYFNLRIKVGQSVNNLSYLGEYKFGSDGNYPEERYVAVPERYLEPGENVLLLENANPPWSGHWLLWDSLRFGQIKKAYYQWYDTNGHIGSGQIDRLVPSIDNAWLVASLITIREYAKANGEYNLANQSDNILKGIDFTMWYNYNDHRFFWGDIDDPKNGAVAAYYSDENRIINFLAFALGQINQSEFQASLDALNQQNGSYGNITVDKVNLDGSYFTYASPALFIREKDTPYAQTLENATWAQIKYAEDKGYPCWGISDGISPINPNDYLNLGAPPVAGSYNDLGVLTPYASALALVNKNPELLDRAIANLICLENYGDLYDSRYGFRDSINVSDNVTSTKFLTLDQEWTLLSLANYKNNTIWKYFYMDYGVQKAHKEMYGASTWTVDDSGGADYMRIQDAIDNASAGDIILVYSGTYYENVDVNKELILRGIDDGGGKPVVDGYNTGKNWFAITLTAGWSTLEGFATTNATDQNWPNAGIIINSNNNIVKNNTAWNNVIGMFLLSSSNNELDGNNVNSNNHGFYIDSSINNSIEDNTATSNNFAGIYLIYSSDNVLRNNNAINNGGGISYGGGISLRNSNNNMLCDNNVLNNTNGFLFASSNNNALTDNIADSNEKGIYLILSSNNNKVDDNNVSNNTYGLYLRDSSYNIINSNNAWNNGVGINLNYAVSRPNYNLLNGNNVSNNGVGIRLYKADHNTMNNNTVSNNYEDGIYILFSSNNAMNNNIVSNNYEDGIYILSSSNNTMNNNIVSNNNDYGIYLDFSSNNILYHNNLVDNTVDNAYDTSGNNQWDNAYPSGGNYWSDYTGEDQYSGLNQTLFGSDGIGDVPYDISGGGVSQDRHPLMQPWNESGSEFISIGLASAPMNSTITIPVNVANVTNISGISFNLLYNSSVVTVSSVSANESFTGSSITPNIDNVNGITNIVLTNSNLISASAETPVIDIAFNVTGGSGSSTSLNLLNVEFSDANSNPYTPAVVVDGQITVGTKGDFNGNGRVDIGDVAKVAFMVARKVPEDLNADFNGNGRVDIGDAAKIAFYLAGKVSEL